MVKIGCGQLVQDIGWDCVLFLVICYVFGMGWNTEFVVRNFCEEKGKTSSNPEEVSDISNLVSKRQTIGPYRR